MSYFFPFTADPFLEANSFLFQYTPFQKGVGEQIIKQGSQKLFP